MSDEEYRILLEENERGWTALEHEDKQAQEAALREIADAEAHQRAVRELAIAEAEAEAEAADAKAGNASLSPLLRQFHYRLQHCQTVSKV